MRSALDRELPRWLGPLLAWRLAILFLIYASIVLLPDIFDVARWSGHFRWPEGADAPTLADALKTWDGNRYLHIADVGYIQGHASSAYYPLWPLLIRIVSPLTGGSTLAAALLLSNVLAIASGLLLHRMVEERSGAASADGSLILLVAFPGALFLGLPYAEALFLFLAILLLLLLQRGRGDLAIIPALLLPMTRPQGALLLLPLAVWAWTRRRSGEATWKPDRHDIVVTAPVLGWGIYLLGMWAAVGNPFEGFDAQRHFHTQSSILRVFDIVGFARLFFGAAESLHGVTTSLIDRACVLWVIACLPALWKRDKVWFAYVLALGVIPAMSAPMVSFTRYAVVVFPIFVVTASALSTESRRPWMLPIVTMLAGIQFLLLIRHVNNMWAG